MRPVIVGIAVAAMARAIGLESFSGAWWVFEVATITVAYYSGSPK